MVVLVTATIITAYPLATIGAAPAGASTRNPLRARLLTTADMPQGWTRMSFSHQPNEAASLPNCLAGAKKKPDNHTDKVSVAFKVIDSGFPGIGPYPVIFETLETGDTGIATWDRGLQTMQNCHTIDLKSQGQTVHGTINSLAVPEVGDRSAAYAFGFNLARGLVHMQLDVVYFEIGRYRGTLAYGNIGIPNPTTLAGFADEAVDKIEGQPTHPPPTSVN